MSLNASLQRDTYKLVEKLISGSFPDEHSLLKSLVSDIVNQEHFAIKGGRIWEFNSERLSYKLVFQHGLLNKIPDDYEVLVSDQLVLSELNKKKTVLSDETDILLQELGIKLYSVTGVGEIFNMKPGRYYKYIMGFNAPEIPDYFFEFLNIISSVTTMTLRNLKAGKESEKFRREMNNASEIQRNLLPDHHLRFHDYDIFGVCVPDSEVGGDYFDYIKREDTEEDSIGIVISDAASKGLPAAIQALFVSGAIRMGLSYANRIADIFSKMNTLIFDTFLYERFVTLFYCELALSQNRVAFYVNAGHCAPIHYRPNKDKISLLLPTGGLLGLMRKQKFGLENVRIHSGDVIVLYTDGITEAMNKDNEIYGEERLIETIKKLHHLEAKEIAYAILEEVQKFTAESRYGDDRTIVVIKRDPKPATPKIIQEQL